MSVAKVTEIISSSETSFEDAINVGVSRACKTLKNVKGAWVKEQTVKIKKEKISEYRVALMVTFVLDD
ncbi:MAG: dodecin domain-containing protein [Planctomycetales bacterium]|nr:dodecin domain-containing protein [Planctomycetales bacterium]